MEINKKTLRNLFLVVAAGIFFYWLLHDVERVGAIFKTIKGIFSPFILGAGIAFVLNVPTRAFEGLLKKIEKRKPRRALAIAMTIVAVLLVLTLVFVLLIPQLIDTIEKLIDRLSGINIEATLNDLYTKYPEFVDWIINNTNIEDFDLASLLEQFLSVIASGFTSVIGSTFSAISSIFGGLYDFIIALFFSVYCLFQKETLARQGRKLLYAFLPERISDQIIRILRLSNSTFSNFLSGQCVEVCILGSLFAICMAIFGMPYIPLVSILIAVTAFIPIVGGFIGCIVGAFLIFVNDPSSWQTLIFIAMFLVIQQLENNLIYPRVVGTSIGLNGMWVLIAVSVGGEVLGIAGMFLMIPFASVLYTLLREVTNKRLGKLEINKEKLKDQPPELRSHFKEKQKINKEKRHKRKAERKAKKESK